MSSQDFSPELQVCLYNCLPGISTQMSYRLSTFHTSKNKLLTLLIHTWASQSFLSPSMANLSFWKLGQKHLPIVIDSSLLFTLYIHSISISWLLDLQNIPASDHFLWLPQLPSWFEPSYHPTIVISCLQYCGSLLTGYPCLIVFPHHSNQRDSLKRLDCGILFQTIHGFSFYWVKSKVLAVVLHVLAYHAIWPHLPSHFPCSYLRTFVLAALFSLN